MSQKQKSGGLDIFRIIAALLVISIHTSPFSGISENLDFFVTRISTIKIGKINQMPQKYGIILKSFFLCI